MSQNDGRQTTPATLQGGCLCGAIRFRAQGRPLRVNYCHCGQCRRHSGAPVAAFATFRAADVEWIGASPRLFRSSAEAQRGFCPDCGTSLSWQGDAGGGEALVDLGVGCFDDASSFSPADHLWTGRALPWFHVADALPRHARERGGD